MTVKYAYTYLTMVAGNRAGRAFLLDPTDYNRIGRGLECDVVLADPLCSRVHAELVQEDDGWFLKDSESRNGTYVNDVRIDSVRLDSGSRVRMGSTEFTFHYSDEPPTQATGTTEPSRIIQQTPIVSDKTDEFVIAALRHADNQHDLLVLYRLAVQLLGAEEPDEVTRIALHTLRERTKAAVVGFLWATDDGQLKPSRVIPADEADQILLSESLTDIVLKHSQAVWVANQGLETSESLREYADAICVPMINNQQTLGAIHLYLRNGSFRQVDFDFAISLAHVVVVALARSRRQATLRVDHDRLRASSAASDMLIGECEAMRTLKEKMTRIARATGCVLVRGESGTGKELVARAIHKLSSREDRPLLCVNCAAVPAELMESQLFGHIKGAFTSAHEDHEGWFRQADSGSLFLDEVGELTPDGQAKLLRVLEGHAFLPVGGTEEVTVDVRVIAATNRDLREAVQQKRFREDLYYRLSVFELVIPPLRDRESDVELLLDHFLNHFRVQHGRPQLKLSDAARSRLLEYDWPGNVRQLRNVIDSATVLAASEEITCDDLGLYEAGTEQFETLNIAQWERKLIGEALQRTQGNVPDAAEMLGIGRATLYRKIDEFNIER